MIRIRKPATAAALRFDPFFVFARALLLRPALPERRIAFVELLLAAALGLAIAAALALVLTLPFFGFVLLLFSAEHHGAAIDDLVVTLEDDVSRCAERLIRPTVLDGHVVLAGFVAV